MATRLTVAMVLLVFSAGAAPARREPIGYGAQFAAHASCTCNHVAKKCIFAHPPWQGARGRVVGRFELDLRNAREPSLAFHRGIQDGHGSDQGLIFRVAVDGKNVWSEFWKDAVWSELDRVTLQPYAGKKIALELAVDSLGEHYAVWGEPRIVDDERVLYDLADLVPLAEKFVDLMDEVPAEEMPESFRRKNEEERRAATNVRPTPQQLAWQELEFIGFAHFGMNTFTDREWGEGTEDPKLFNPTAFDARQWVAVCKDAGIKLLILTCKHHDGFCLWPSAYTEHSVKRSPWKGGTGDVVREVSDACRAGGIKFGVYLSPWDRNQPAYGDSPRYNEYFKNQLAEILGNYGPIAEVWFDGACGEGPNGKRQEYDWRGYYETVRRLQPDALIAISGPDVRWVGNESGVARETEWSVQPGNPLFHGTAKFVWWPAECDVSIRPGWFYHASQDREVKSLAALLDIHYKSVGRNSVLLLNLPPDQRGLIHENDRRRLVELRGVLDATFRENLVRGGKATGSNVRGNAGRFAAANAIDGDGATCWAVDENFTSCWLEIDLGKPVTFNRAMIREYIPEGQRVEAYALEVWDGTSWQACSRGTTIGYKKLDRFPDTTATKVRLIIQKSRAAPLIRELGLFRAPAEG
jgi:alpha-L-fucosidase